MSSTSTKNQITRNLVQRVIQGDNTAQKEFIRITGKIVYGALSVFHNLSPHEKSDLFQTVYLKLFEDDMRRIKLWKGDSRFSTFLYRIVINQVKDYFGSAYYRQSMYSSSDNNDEEFPSIRLQSKSEQPDSVIRTISLMHLISSLRDIEKTVIHYYYFEGYREREIAEMLDYPLNTISSIKNRALKKLKSSWERN